MSEAYEQANVTAEDFENEDSDWMKLMNARVVFGLEAQGHILTIEKMLSEKKTWDEIGDRIGWCPKTAKEHYERYLGKKSKNDETIRG